MDALFEFILEIIIEGVKSKRIPKGVRFILFGIIIAIFSSVMGLLIYFSLDINNDAIIKLIFLGLALIIGVFLFNLIKEMRERK